MIRVSTRIIGGRGAWAFDGTCIFRRRCERCGVLGYKKRYSVWVTAVLGSKPRTFLKA